MRRTVERTAWGLILLLAAAVPAVAAPLEPSLRLEPDPIGLEELAVLEIQVDGLEMNRHFDATFKLDNLRLVQGPSHVSSVQIINGVPSTSRSLSWRLRPLAVGPARVRDVRVQVGAEEIELDGAEITVQEEIPAERRRAAARARDPFDVLRDDPFGTLFDRRRRRPRARAEPKIFLRAEASPRRPWVGQQVLYTLYLLTQVDIPSVNPEEMPDFQGFWVREIPNQDRMLEMVTHEGERYGRAVLLQRALFPRRDGQLSIGPVRAQLTARIPDDSPFGAIFSRTTELERVSNGVNLEVRPLPAPPAGFRGAVGRLQLAAELEPRELAVGEAATLTLTLRGEGHLQGLPEPQLPELPGIKVFPPQQQARERLRGTVVTGTRVWSFVLVPERPGTWQLPPLEVPFFDPRKGSYQVARAGALTLTARGATSLTQDGGETVELHPIRNAALPAAQAGWRLEDAARWLFALPWLLVAAVLLLRRGSELGGAHRQARKALLEQLAGAVDEEQPRRAAACIEEAWRAFLNRRWGVPPGAPSNRWQALLEERGVKASHAAELVRLADDLHYLRYAPKLSSTAELQRELIERSRKLARVLA